jgi:predicted RNA-binding protein with PIN domain
VNGDDPTTGTERRGSFPSLPESLLVPLLDTAADVLRGLEPSEVPLSLRPVAGFDRRGLARSAARQQLLRAIETDETFHRHAIERFTERREVEAALEAWEPYRIIAIVEDAAERADLPLLASTLYAARPAGWKFGLGFVCAIFERARVDQETTEDRKTQDMQIAGIAESRRRADAARTAAEQKIERLEKELREERAGRRARETQANQVAAAAEHHVESVERDLVNARTALEVAEARLQREAERARAAEEQLREARRAPGAAGIADGQAGDSGLPVLRAEDLRALVDAADLAARLAAGLSGVAEQAQRMLGSQGSDAPVREAGAPRATTPRATTPRAPARERPARRAQARVPPGMVEDAPDVLEAMLRTPRAVLIVDGYNVSMLAWGTESAAAQRERLIDALAELQMRTRAKVTVVFDGADVEGARPPQRRRGVSVVFSPAGEEADAVVLREASELPIEVPVIVASSDNWVADNARTAGARVVSSSTLLRSLRR